MQTIWNLKRASSIRIAMSGIVGTHLVLAGEHLPTPLARKLPRTVDVLIVPPHGSVGVELLGADWAGVASAGVHNGGQGGGHSLRALLAGTG